MRFSPERRTKRHATPAERARDSKKRSMSLTRCFDYVITHNRIHFSFSHLHAPIYKKCAVSGCARGRMLVFNFVGNVLFARAFYTRDVMLVDMFFLARVDDATTAE